jgi:hypothetical protein
MNIRLIATLAVLLTGCSTVPKRALLLETKIPAPALSSSIEIRRAQKVTSDGTKEIQYRTRTIKEEIIKIQEIVPPEIAERLKKVEFQLDETLVKLQDMETANDLLLQQIAFKEMAEVRMRDWGIMQEAGKHAAETAWILADQNWKIEEKNHNKTKVEFAVIDDSNNRRGNLVGWLSGSTLAFLGLRMVSFANLWSLLFPVAGGIGGYFLSRFII